MSSYKKSDSECGANCSYERLYRGAQSTLTEMADSQRKALVRAAKVREGILTAMRTSMPRSFNELEAQVNARLSDADDEMLVAYVTYLITQAVAGDSPQDNWPAREEFKVGLEALGVILDSNDPLEWLRDIDKWAAKERAKTASLTTFSSSVAKTNPRTGRSLLDAVEDRANRHRRSLSQVAASRNSKNESQDTEVAEKNTDVHSSDSAESVSYIDIDAAPPSPDQLVEADTGTVAGQPPKEDSGAPSDSDPDQDSPQQLDSDPAPESHAADHASAANAETDSELDSDDFVSPLDMEEELTELSDFSPSEETVEADEFDDFGEVDFEPLVSPDKWSEKEEEKQAQPSDSAQEHPPPAATSIVESAVSKEVATTSSPKPVVVKPTFAPNLFGGGSAKPPARKRRKRKVKALPPSDTELDIANEVISGTLDAGTMEKIDAAVAVPRPMFLADMEELFQPEAVAIWKENRRRDGDIIKFIAPKPRHIDRGDLLVPVGWLRTASSSETSSWWTECITIHTGARLFEMAVVLHSYGSNLLTHSIHDHGKTNQLRIRSPRGTIGAIVVTASDVDDGTEARVALQEDIEALMSHSDQLEYIVVVTTTDPAYKKMCDAIVADASARQWNPPCQIVAARSWDWATKDSTVLEHLAG